ncbi:hypothetical protein HBE96_23280 [Clostridium sp. P21]|uniref:Uncharacterized protein n=1 Tax=Clostridium muellerianum TaxID=2716538 RepID=A0A7Y0HPW7_9CLOT|nr:hypothetical protein [Clostridium muellerianum]NMM65504.1 hypothetical protein [Clostridium muellerianum]
MSDKNIQMAQRNENNTAWDNLYPKTKAVNVDVNPIDGIAGSDVQTILNNLFQYASNGKTAVANAVTAKGVSASPSDTFSVLATKVGQINTGKKSASGSIGFSSYFSSQDVTGLQFVPSIILLRYSYAYSGASHIGHSVSLYMFDGWYTMTDSWRQDITVNKQPTSNCFTANYKYTADGGYNGVTGSSFDWIAIE